MNQHTNKQLMVGLPGTGKTTFLAALWHIVESGEIPGALRLERLHGNLQYLNEIRNSWLGCRPLARTVPGAERVVSMRLYEPQGRDITEVVIPDLSGESFNSQWKDRKWTKEYDSLVKAANGALIFVHPEKLKEPTRIDMADPLVAELDENGGESPSEIDDFIPWNPEFSPTQVKMVDLLQFLALYLNASSPLRIALIISAWDLVLNDEKAPSDWLSYHLPLLEQYLGANHDKFTTKVFGVSAQGGELEMDSAQLCSRMHASERVIVEIDGCPKSHDLTAPIKWVMG